MIFKKAICSFSFNRNDYYMCHDFNKRSNIYNLSNNILNILNKESCSIITVTNKIIIS